MLEIGTLVDGKYKILSEIGHGGMSVVYMAINEKANKTWAVKEVRKDGVLDFEAVKQGLIVETDMLKRLKHPNLPSIVDVIEDEETFLIVMDYIEGNSLSKALDEYGAQTQEHVIAWAKQLCDVLGYLHSREPAIIYRDMKPANIMLKPDGNLTLIDFGTAREFKEKNLADTTCLGTVGYAAPEQFGGMGQTDARTDIYCLGATLYHLVTGCNPSEPPYEIKPIREINPNLSGGLEKIIQKCTQRNPADRYQSAAELMYALEHYWEYDRQYQKRQKKAFFKFLAPTALTLIFGAGAVIFAVLEKNTTANTYTAYLDNAQKALSQEEAIENYRKAINLRPESGQAYMELLENVILGDPREFGIVPESEKEKDEPQYKNDFMTIEENEMLRSVLIEYGNGKETNENAFKKNAKEYEAFSYELGVTYFYKFELSGNKQSAKGYFEVAANSSTLSDRQVERAKRLLLISDYYSKIGIVDEAGDALITYREYWDDLVSLSEGNIVEDDNARTALVMYRELVSQVVSRTVEFKKAGVEQQEIMQQLESIEQHLQDDFKQYDQNTREDIDEEIQSLVSDIQRAKKIVQSAYGQEAV